MPFDIQAARQAGKTDDQIAYYLGSSLGFDVQAALEAGKTSTQIAEYLAVNDRPPEPSAPAAPAPPAEPAPLPKAELGPRTGAGLAKRAGNIADIFTKNVPSGESYLGSLGKMEDRLVEAGGELGAAVGEIGMKGIKSAYQAIVPEDVRGFLAERAGVVANGIDAPPIREGATPLSDVYGGAKEMFPATMKRVESVANMANLVPAYQGAKLAGPLAKEGGALLVDAAKLTGRGAKAAAGKIIPKNAAQDILESGAKWSTVISDEERARLTKTMFREKLDLGRGGYRKLQGEIKAESGKLKEALDPYKNEPIDVDAVLSRTEKTLKNTANTAEATKNREAVEGVIAQFKADHPNLTVASSQKVKQDIYDIFNRHYDSMARTGTSPYASSEIQAWKDIAKGLKEEIELAAPGANVKGINSRLGDLLDLEPHLRRAAGRIGNHNFISLDDSIAAGAGAAAGAIAGGPVGAAVGMAATGLTKKVLGSPGVKSRIARTLAEMQGAQQPARLVSRTGQALTAEQPTLAAYLSPGSEVVPARLKAPGDIQTSASIPRLVGDAYGPQPTTRAELVAARNAGTIEAERAAQPRMFEGTQPPVSVGDLNPGLQADIDKFLRRQAAGTELATIPPQAPRGDFANLLLQLKMRQPQNISLHAQKSGDIMPATLGRSANGRLLSETPAQAARFATEQNVDLQAALDASGFDRSAAIDRIVKNRSLSSAQKEALMKEAEKNPKVVGREQWAKEQYDNGVIPDGWQVHGRALRGDLNTGHQMLFVSDSWDVADQYAGKTGSKWLIKPKEGAKVLDLSDQDGIAMDALVEKAKEQLRQGKFSKEITRDIEGATWEKLNEESLEKAIRESFSPENVISEGRAYDAPTWIKWLRSNFGADYVKLSNGSVVLNKRAIDSAKVGPDLPNPSRHPEATLSRKATPTATLINPKGRR